MVGFDGKVKRVRGCIEWVVGMRVVGFVMFDAGVVWRVGEFVPMRWKVGS